MGSKDDFCGLRLSGDAPPLWTQGDAARMEIRWCKGLLSSKGALQGQGWAERGEGEADCFPEDVTGETELLAFSLRIRPHGFV